jgi:diadenosine tetraphosphate (Ap4A) HIT family hydrolase
MDKTFAIKVRLSNNNFSITTLKLCHVLLYNDERFPWVVMVPSVPNIHEIHQLTSEKQHELADEISKVSLALQIYSHADKIEMSTFLDMKSQLHIHLIARNKQDQFWPNPVKETENRRPYLEIEKDTVIKDLQEMLLRF